jgi:hypothetical protein
MTEKTTLTFDISPRASTALKKIANDQKMSPAAMARRIIYEGLWGADARAVIETVKQNENDDFELTIPVCLTKKELDELDEVAFRDGVHPRQAARVAIRRELHMRRRRGDKFDPKIWHGAGEQDDERAGLARFIANAETVVTVETK